MPTPSYLQFSSVPPPIAEASELERALLAVVPVSPRLDALGKEIA